MSRTGDGTGVVLGPEVGESGAVHGLRRDGTVAPRRRVLAAAGAGLGVFGLLGAGVLVGFAPQVRLDEAVSHALYAGDDRSAALDLLLEVLTTPGVVWFRVLVSLPVLFWLGARRAWWTAAWVVIANVGVSPLTVGLKELVGRVRPAFENGGASYEGLSFPSGHSSGIATAVTIALVLAWPRLAPGWRRPALAAGLALAVLVGLTRMWLGVHFLSDVVGGLALGTAWTLALALLVDALPGGRAALPPREEP
ncbi:phosphatase PAP2 family protein [Geodermatophilus sabuli]|uniref:Undecaprenyl-diphosphatase n=1 Tax=Geodermatophilus sabuli TaxID=1564158 RepID=A0A285E6U2_9ACTN|nr:phosphatase PAP2 family protein [Geodermatophilus sabuli]MBB3082289.1 undecaprenyl-diphosphatase [Geodermatophilus sabuli]SNX94839.1 undecaprenyl-diphosphatase [Geodermatophilus sabuli]